MSFIACPCCDVEELSLKPLQALALGLGLRPSPELTLAEQMCERHRMPFVQAMLGVATAITRAKGAS